MTTSKKNVILDFRYYGTGNVGDDLTIAGFAGAVDVADRARIWCHVKARTILNIWPRVPEVTWVTRPFAKLPQADVWLGVGTTPFQVTSGMWLMDYITEALTKLPSSVPRHLVAVGAEQEARREAGRVAWILENLTAVTTRDEESRRLLAELNPAAATRISAAADLSHVALRRVFPVVPTGPRLPLAVCYYNEVENSCVEAALRDLSLKHLERGPVDWWANHVGPDYERAVFDRVFAGSARRPRFRQPSYMAVSIERLVRHFSGYEVVLSSRFHALVTAAWAGAKVVAISRSSKIAMLARTLDIPHVSDTAGVAAIDAAIAEARPANRQALERFAESALACVEDFWKTVL